MVNSGNADGGFDIMAMLGRIGPIASEGDIDKALGIFPPPARAAIISSLGGYTIAGVRYIPVANAAKAIEDAWHGTGEDGTLAAAADRNNGREPDVDGDAELLMERLSIEEETTRRLSEEKRAAERRAAKAEENAEALQNRLDKALAEITVQEGKGKLKAENKALSKSLEDARKEIEELKGELCEIDAQGKDIEDNSRCTKKIAAMQIEIDTLHELMADVEKDEAGLKDEVSRLNGQCASLKAELGAERTRNAALKESLEQAMKAQPATLDIDIDTFYPDEIMDFVRILARRNAERLEDSRDKRKREYDLSKAIAETGRDSGWQMETMHELEKASKDMLEGKDFGFLRIGFEKEPGRGSHRKYTFRGKPRYTLVLPTSCSDARAWRNCLDEASSMLLFDDRKEAKA